MLSAAGQAFNELFTPPFRAVLVKCVAFTIGLRPLNPPKAAPAAAQSGDSK
jgi:hypothetical protein